MLPDDVVSILRCPRCGGGVARDDTTLRCEPCDVRFPSFGDVPCLLPDPRAFAEDWRGRLEIVRGEGSRTRDMFLAQAKKPALLPSSRSRLEHLADASRRVCEEIDGIVGPAFGEGETRRPPPTFRPLEHLHLVHRDWGWHASDENEQALQLIARVIDAPLGRTLVLGTGASRLAYDLHRAHGAAPIVAVDVDPLLLLVARRVMAGETLTVTEAVAQPHRLDALSAARDLRAPHGAVDGVHLLFADGLAPPVARGAFDTVVTPWFIDVVPDDLRELVPRIADHLVPGGRWIDLGPLLYRPTSPPAIHFTRDEVLELARLAGFTVEKEANDTAAFARSPLTGRGRIEQPIAFCARRGAPPSDIGKIPPWLVFPSLPVPAIPDHERFAHPVAPIQALARLCNGARSIDDMATALAAPGTRPDGALKDAVRHTLGAIHPGCIVPVP